MCIRDRLNAAYDAKYKEYADAMEQAGMEPSKEEFLELWKSGLSEEQYTLWAFSKTDEYDAQLSEADSVNQLLEGFNMSVGQMQALVSALGPSTSTVLSQLSNLCGALGDSGLSGTLSQLLKNADSGMDHLRNLGQTGEDLAGKLQEVLELVETLNTTVDSYIPEAQQALADAKVLAGAAVSGTEDPVSYTHLDVYKRQHVLWPGGRIDTDLCRIRKRKNRLSISHGTGNRWMKEGTVI